MIFKEYNGLDLVATAEQVLERTACLVYIM